jgi:hypothetical protein
MFICNSLWERRGEERKGEERRGKERRGEGEGERRGEGNAACG